MPEDGSITSISGCGHRAKPARRGGVCRLSPYHAESAWTLGDMALTRARAIAGPAELTREIDEAIRATLTAPRDPVRLAADVADMRRRIAADTARTRWILNMRSVESSISSSSCNICCSDTRTIAWTCQANRARG